MLDLIVAFKEPIYTRRSILNHDYDITLNEISTYSKSKAFSDAGYCFALLYRIKLYGRHEKKMFLDHQLNLAKDSLR